MKKLNFKPKAIIFDMDGVIIDSMPYHFIAWYEALRPYGVRVSCFDVYSKEGERWDKTLKSLFEKSGKAPSKKIFREIFKYRQKIFKQYFKRFVFQGVKGIIRCLKSRGYLIGLVTGTPIRDVKKILPKNILILFDEIVAGDQVKLGKPHPEPYWKASKLLKVKPSECLVVENAPFGIESAKKAGMCCIGLTTGLPKAYLKGADIVLDELSEIVFLIDKSCSV